MSHSISTPPWVEEIVSDLHIVRLALPEVNAIDGSTAIVIEPVAETWLPGSLHPKALFAVVTVNPNTVSAARPAIVGSPNIVTEFVADCTCTVSYTHLTLPTNREV